MYLYTIHIHAYAANISVDRARTWTEENGKGVVVAESNMGGSQHKHKGNREHGGDRTLMGNRRNDQIDSE